MPDGSLMVSFTQATGPVNGRLGAPDDVLRQLSWPPEGNAGYDMTGLDLRNVHLRSTDAGTTWNKVSADPFKSPMNGITGEAQTALPDGTIIRGVWGYYLPYNPELPKTGYLERSTNGSKTWGKPEVLSTCEGPILHVATSGVSWTGDAGTTWHKLNVPGTAYYPRSLQHEDGTIYIFGHIGGDNSYGSVDQAIVMDSFRLTDNRPQEQSQQGCVSAARSSHSRGKFYEIRETKRSDR